MVEGGSGSLDEARLRVGSGLPLIILADSGRVADVLCAAYDMAIVTSLVDGWVICFRCLDTNTGCLNTWQKGTEKVYKVFQTVDY